MSGQDTTESKRLLTGCRDWKHTTWNAEYYPHDMPAEWQLSYYANEMACVLLPANRWQGISPAAFANWSNDVPAGFLFFLELPEGDSAAAGRDIVPALGNALGGLVRLPLTPGTVAACVVPYTGGQAAIPVSTARGVMLLDVAGKSLRQQRSQLEQAAPQFQGFDQVAVILTGENLLPAQVTDFQRLAELMDFS